jgi:hypothetical protein
VVHPDDQQQIDRRSGSEEDHELHEVARSPMQHKMIERYEPEYCAEWTQEGEGRKKRSSSGKLGISRSPSRNGRAITNRSVVSETRNPLVRRSSIDPPQRCVVFPNPTFQKERIFAVGCPLTRCYRIGAQEGETMPQTAPHLQNIPPIASF